MNFELIVATSITKIVFQPSLRSFQGFRYCIPDLFTNPYWLIGLCATIALPGDVCSCALGLWSWWWARCKWALSCHAPSTTDQNEWCVESFLPSCSLLASCLPRPPSSPSYFCHLNAQQLGCTSNAQTWTQCPGTFLIFSVPSAKLTFLLALRYSCYVLSVGFTLCLVSLN